VTRSSLLSLLTGAIAVLGAVVAVALWSDTGGDSDASAIAASNHDSGTISPPAVPPMRTDGPRLTAQILARPLFAMKRRPDENVPEQSPDPVVSDLPRLAGIVTIMNVKFAVFQPQNGAKPIVVSVGDMLDGRTVQSIAVDEIVLTGPDGAEHLHPMPDPALEHASRPIPGGPVRHAPRPVRERRIVTP
jgi:hypothetical protein